MTVSFIGERRNHFFAEDAYISRKIYNIMAKSKNFIIGKMRGAIGSVIFSVVKGQNVARSRPESVFNPNTAGQLRARKALDLIVSLYRKASSVFKVGFRQTANPRSPYNGYVSVNNPAALSGSTVETLEYDYPNLLISKGTMGITPISSVVADESDGNVTITWDENLAAVGSAPSDRAIVLVVNKENDGVAGYVTSALRSAGTVTVDAEMGIQENDKLQVYLAFRSSVSNEVSDSVNIEATVVA